MTPQPAQHAGEEKNILIRGHDGDWSELSRADYLYMPVDLLTLSDLGLPALGKNGLNDELNVGE